jgi:hypothetical protein
MKYKELIGEKPLTRMRPETRQQLAAMKYLAHIKPKQYALKIKEGGLFELYEDYVSRNEIGLKCIRKNILMRVDLTEKYSSR